MRSHFCRTRKPTQLTLTGCKQIILGVFPIAFNMNHFLDTYKYSGKQIYPFVFKMWNFNEDVKTHLKFATVIPLSFRVRIAFTSDSGWWETKYLLLLKRTTLHLMTVPLQQGKFTVFFYINTIFSPYLLILRGQVTDGYFYNRPRHNLLLKSAFQKDFKDFFLISRKMLANLWKKRN